MNSPINVGILGYGYMGEIRKKYLDLNPDCRVKSIFHTTELKGDFDYFNGRTAPFSSECIQLYAGLRQQLRPAVLQRRRELPQHARPPGGLRGRAVRRARRDHAGGEGSAAQRD